MGYYLGIDIGSFESKGVLIDAAGNIIAVSSKQHTMETPRPGYAEHDAEKVWWGDFCYLSKRLLSQSGIQPKEILGVGCSAIAPCCLPVDDKNRPLRKAILYGVDVRAGKQIEAINNEMGEEYLLKKYGNPVTSQSVGPKILWLKENEPEIYQKTAKFITASTFLVARLTGRYVIDHYTAAYFTPLYDPASETWDETSIARFCRRDQLADCLWTDEIAGFITKSAAEETGLAVGTPVTVGTADAAADAVGAGVFRPGDMLLMFGSSLYMIHVVPKRFVDRRYWSGPFLFKGTSMVASGMSTAGTLTRWFRDTLAQDLVQAQERGEGNAYDLLMDSIAEIPPGSDGLLVLPYFSGERTPIHDPKAKGVFFGMTLQHTRGHLYQACLESIGYGIEQHLRGYSELGIETKRMVAVGGGTKTPKWMQMVADITGRKISIGGVYGAAFGDALLAALSTCSMTTTEMEKIIRFKKEMLPNEEHYKMYKPIVDEYIELYNSTKTIMHRLKN